MDADVLVVGAGIAGLTVADRLLAGGLSIDVVERSPHLRAAGAGIMLHPNALACVPELEGELRRHGAVIERQVVVDPGATTVVDWRKVWGTAGLPIALHRGRLAELLARAVPPGMVRWGTAPTGIAQDGAGVSVRLDEDRPRRYRLVVGADGVGSWVRAAVEPRAVPQPLGQTYWRTTVPARPPFDFPEWRVWRSGARFFGAMPIGGERAHVFVQDGSSAPGASPAQPARETMRALARTMGAAVEGLVEGLGGDEEVDVRRPLGVAAARVAAGRIVLVGDAAHAVSPATTQGGALAVEDATVLADEVGRHGPCPAAVLAYERRRRPRVERFVRLARMHLALMESMRPVAPAAAPRHGQVQDGAAWFRRLYEPLMALP